MGNTKHGLDIKTIKIRKIGFVSRHQEGQLIHT